MNKLGIDTDLEFFFYLDKKMVPQNRDLLNLNRCFYLVEVFYFFFNCIFRSLKPDPSAALTPPLSAFINRCDANNL